MAQSSSQQRADVGLKYQILYRTLKHVVRAILADSQLSPLHRCEQLKYYTNAVWGTMFARRLNIHENLASHLVDVGDFYNSQPKSWSENGVERTGTQRDFDQSLDDLVVRSVAEYIDPQCDLFLDLGCGWGHRTFDVWRNGIAQGARFYGGDRSWESGEIVRMVSSLFDGMKVDWFPFDFLQPNFGFLPNSARNITVLSVHAIEQVEFIGPGLFDRLLAHFPEAVITGIHLEPVTFQIARHRVSNANVNVALDRSCAEGHRYNMDLYDQIISQPRLRLVARQPGILDGGTGNSTSLLVWRTV